MAETRAGRRLRPLLYWLHEPTVHIGAERDKAAEVKLVPRLPVLAGGRKRAASALLVGVAVAAVYGLAAPFAAPRLARLALERNASTGEWTARIGQIHYEPFALAFDLEDMQVSGRNGEVAAAAGLVRIDFSLRSLFVARPALDRLAIRGGSLRLTQRAAPAVWSLVEAFATDASVARLDAEVDAAAFAAAGEESPFRVELRGTGLELGRGRGTLTVVAAAALGEPSRLAADLTAEPADAGARLRGTATVTRGQLALADWTLDVPSAAFTVDATLSAAAAAASVALLDGAIAAIDRGISNARFDMTGARAVAAWQAATGFDALQASASLADGGRAELALAQGPDGAVEIEARLDAVRAADLAPYAVRALGAEPAGGTVGVEVSVRSGDSAGGLARITTRALRLATDDPSAATAIALLEDTAGEITLDVPLSRDRRAAEQIIEHVAERATALATMPFEALAALVGRDAGELAAVEFAPGAADPTPRGDETIAALAAALKLRERVGLRLDADAGAAVDRAALARSQVVLHVTLATAQAERLQGAAMAIDFASPRAQDVLDEFARERLGAAAVAAIGASLAFDAAAPPAAPQRVAYYRALFEALAAREPIRDAALRRLADFRARTVERRLRELGVADSRVVAGDAAQPPADGVLALLPLALGPAAPSDALR